MRHDITQRYIYTKNFDKDRELASQLSPDIIDQRKVYTNFFWANFEYLRDLTARDDANY